MKRIIWISAAALLLFSCEQAEEVLTVESGDTRTISAIIDNDTQDTSNTRIDIHPSGGAYSHYWQEEDAIKVFNDASGSATFTISNGIGTSDAEFTGTLSGTITGAVYPAANPGAAYDGTDFTVTVPAEQTYAIGTYDKNANIYIATGSNVNSLVFKSIMSYIRLAYYSSSSASVDSIVVTAIGGEKIAGQATVSNDGAITMGGAAVSSIRLNCPSPVALSADSGSPTYFYLAIPAVSISSGLEVKVYSTVSEAKTFLFRNIATAPVRNKVLEMPAMNHAPLAASSTANLKAVRTFNVDLKTLAGTDCSGVDPYKTSDYNITRIIFETNKNMTGVTGTDVSEETDGSLIASFNAGVIRVQTAASSITLPADCASMLRAFRSLTAIDNLSALNTSAVTTLSYAFCNDESLTSLDLSGFDTRNVTKVVQTFYYCSNLNSITFGPKCTFGKTNDYSLMFNGCSSLTTLDLTPFVWESTSTRRNCDRMFAGCTKLESIAFNPSNMVFRYVSNANRMFANCSSLKSINLSGILNVGASETDDIQLWRMFYGCSELTSVTLNRVNYKRAVNVNAMFYGCSKLASITNLDNITFEAATTMDSLFMGCAALTSLDLGNFKTPNVKSTIRMFKDCTNLGSVSFGANCTFAADTSMTSMFHSCTSLTSLDLSGFDTRNVEEFSYLFYNCSNLTDINMDGTNCSSAAETNIEYFLRGCNRLETAKFGPSFTPTAGVSNFAPNPASLQAATPLKYYCAPDFARKLINAQGYIRTLCNNPGGSAQMRFYSIAQYLADGSDLLLTLSPDYGSVTSSTTVTDPYTL